MTPRIPPKARAFPRRTRAARRKSETMALDLAINPATGQPYAFEAARQLGNAGELFALYVKRVGGSASQSRIFLLASLGRCRTYSHGRGYIDGTAWEYVLTIDAPGVVITDWFTHLGPARVYADAGCRVFDHAKTMPENVVVIGLPDAE